MSECPLVSISVVSHGQAHLIGELMESLDEHCTGPLELLITENLPESCAVTATPRFPTRFLQNPEPKGFGANHNAAFREARGEFFCVLNPDIRLTDDPFPALIECLRQHPDAGVIAPLVTTPEGALEDSAREFPTPWTIVKKLFGRNRDREVLRALLRTETAAVDWVAGMFMLFPRTVFEAMQGFDEAYFLYYEDVDLCSRLRARGRDVLVSTGITAIHDARRESHRNLRYLRWHLASMARFFLTHFLRQRRGIQAS